jgi:hypothetical protein
MLAPQGQNFVDAKLEIHDSVVEQIVFVTLAAAT